MTFSRYCSLLTDVLCSALCVDERGSEDHAFDALWGKLAGEILALNWDDADRDRDMLKSLIDRSQGPAAMQLHQRCWLLHWSLFIFFNRDSGKENLIDFFCHEEYVASASTPKPDCSRTSCNRINRRSMRC